MYRVKNIDTGSSETFSTADLAFKMALFWSTDHGHTCEVWRNDSILCVWYGVTKAE